MLKTKKDGVFRMFFFLCFFSLSTLIVYFTLGKIYGYGYGYGYKLGMTRLYPRSVEEQRKFLIIVFGWRRKESLERLVESLLKSDYSGGNEIELQFHIDYQPSDEVLKYVKSVNWPYGIKSVLQRKEPFGLERMVVESWNPKPNDDSEFAFFFEDDIEVHPKYFQFTLAALKRSDVIDNPDLIGIALNTPRYDEVSLEHSIWSPEMEIGSEFKLFLFQQPCSWGALYFPWKWREYLKYYSTRRISKYAATTIDHVQIIPESCVFEWARSWKKYLMELMVLRGYVMLYPNLPKQASLSIHHREEGEHTGLKINQKHAIVDYFVCPLVKEDQLNVLMTELQKEKLEYPIVTFYHFKTESISNLKAFGALLKHRKYKHDHY